MQICTIIDAFAKARYASKAFQKSVTDIDVQHIWKKPR